MTAHLADIVLTDIAGTPIQLGSLIDRPTIVDLVRYYGCAPCLAYLGDLSARHDAITEIGGAVLAIGPAAAHQARGLQPDLPFPLLLDPERKVATMIGLRRPAAARVLLDPRGWARWARGVARGGRQGAITAPRDLPALLVLDASATVAWAHLGATIGDYPRIEHTIERLAEVVAASR